MAKNSTTDLARYSGADVTELQQGEAFVVALNRLIGRFETESAQLNNGLQTFEVAAANAINHRWTGDEDYTVAVTLSVEAGRRAKAVEEKYSGPTELFHAVHKAFTGLRAKYIEPWTTWRERLDAKAKRWYLDQQRAKAEAERQMAQATVQAKSEIAETVEDLLLQGRVKEARALQSQAAAVMAPVLPPAVPVVPNSRVTPKLKGTCINLAALALHIGSGKAELCYEVKGTMRPLLLIDQVVLNALVDRMGKSLNLPGVVVEDDVQIGAAKL